ncbi:endonuclease VII [Streptomyces viridochromogenes DSM 40736]|uniref:Endonuclease VII n=1 Tax=Streptomyces viridochromogenes (strain DSM 40736 / JCM 4977 / BCRC 1201 / Tue 494) TaxID=591159 RepID=D9WYB3_STRVT|nr:endonuclease VII [Streptomyces viridochromogenes DSM 40736]
MRGAVNDVLPSCAALRASRRPEPAGPPESGGGQVRGRRGGVGAAGHVDHRRRTGRVRGIPCPRWQPDRGSSKDRPDVTGRAVAYVEGIAWKPTLVAPGVYQLPS